MCSYCGSDDTACEWEGCPARLCPRAARNRDVKAQVQNEMLHGNNRFPGLEAWEARAAMPAFGWEAGMLPVLKAGETPLWTLQRHVEHGGGVSFHVTLTGESQDQLLAAVDRVVIQPD